jgi:hypothetical protein
MILGQQAIRVADQQTEQLKGFVVNLNGLIAVPKAFIAKIEPVLRFFHHCRPTQAAINQLVRRCHARATGRCPTQNPQKLHQNTAELAVDVTIIANYSQRS